MTIAGISRTARTGMPGPEGSMIRLFHGELHKRVYQLALDIIGSEALRLTAVDGEGVWTGPYLQSFAYTIGGGTTDIQRNIVGERVLALPRVRGATVDLLPTEEQEEIIATVRSQLEREFALHALADRDGRPGRRRRAVEPVRRARLVRPGPRRGRRRDRIRPGRGGAAVRRDRRARHARAVPGDGAGAHACCARRGDRAARRHPLGRTAGGARRTPRQPPMRPCRHGVRHLPGHRPRRRRPGAGARRRPRVDRRRGGPGGGADGLARSARAHRDRHRVRRAAAVPPRRRRGPAAPGDRPGRGRVGRHRHRDRRTVDRVREGPRAVRPAGRRIPGGQAPLRRHGGARRGRDQLVRYASLAVPTGTTTPASTPRPHEPSPLRPPSTTPRSTCRTTAASASPGSTRRTAT